MRVPSLSSGCEIAQFFVRYMGGYWTPVTRTLEQAQQNKIQLLIDKL